METLAAPRTQIVARQPIFDRRKEVYGYELLCRAESYQSADEATRQVVANTLFSIGMEKVLCGKRAFLKFDHSLLIEDLHAAFAKESLVIEVPQTLNVDQAVIDACRKLHENGFFVALDDFSGED